MLFATGRFEGKLEQYHGNLERAAYELSKEWHDSKCCVISKRRWSYDSKSSFLLSGNEGDCSDDGVLAIGSGGSYAPRRGAAPAKHTDCPPGTFG